MDKQKKIALVASVIGYAIVIAETLRGDIPTEWAALASASIAMLYLAARTVAKMKAGEFFGSIVRSTEFLQAAIVALGSLAMAIAEKMPVEYSAGIIVVLGLALRIAKALVLGQALKPPSATLLALVLAGLVLATPAKVQAQPVAPEFGKCFNGTDTCLGPDLSLSLFKMDLRTKKWSGGTLPVGAGYALLFGSSQWWASGVAVHALFDFSQEAANYVEPSVLLTFLRFGHIGVSNKISSGYQQWSLLAGFTLPIDIITTGYVEEKAMARRALAVKQ